MSAIYIIDPTLFPQSWDTFQVGGVFSPGVVPPGGVSGFERKFQFDRKKGKGAYGETLTFTQKPSAEGKIKIHLGYMRQGLADIKAQFQALADFVPLLQYDPTKTAVKAIDIYHPALALSGVTSVVCEYISPLKHLGKGLWEVEFSFIEFNPPPKASAVSTPNTSQSQGSGATGPAGVAAGGPAGTVADPVGDANDKLIADLLKKAEAP